MTNGLLSMFGQEQSPFANWLDPRRNSITQFGAGLVGAGSTRDALRGASQGLAQGAQMDSAYALQKQEEQKAQDQLNSTIQYLQQAHPDLAQAVSNGADIQSVWGEAMRRSGQGAQGPDYRTIGDTLVQIGPDGVMPVYTAPPSAPTPTSTQRDYEYAVNQGFEGDIFDYQRRLAEAGADGGFNANQGQAAGYADRTIQADQILNDPAVIAALTDIQQQARSNVPMVGNFLTSDQRKQAEQAQRNFINAILRRESGAVISDSEFENAAQQYFPQPGDTPAVIEQKKQNRQLAIQGLIRAAGPSYQMPQTMGANGPQIIDAGDYFR